jgi:hypothetical protein
VTLLVNSFKATKELQHARRTEVKCPFGLGLLGGDIAWPALSAKHKAPADLRPEPGPDELPRAIGGFNEAHVLPSKVDGNIHS